MSSSGIGEQSLPLEPWMSTSGSYLNCWQGLDTARERLAILKVPRSTPCTVQPCATRRASQITLRPAPVIRHETLLDHDRGHPRSRNNQSSLDIFAWKIHILSASSTNITNMFIGPV